MSDNKSPASEQNVELVVANTCSRLGCTVSKAREILAAQSAAGQAANLTPAPAPAQPTSKGGTADSGEALL